MRTGKKGQITAVLVMALIIFIIAAFIMVNSGKPKIQNTRIQNAAQAGVLAGGSSACILLNNMANFNDSMVISFAGFSVMMEFLLLSYTLDYVKLLKVSHATLIPLNYAALTLTILGFEGICLTIATVLLMVKGAFDSGNAIYEMIQELNDDLPKNSRNSARQYAFSNAGVDEPKIPFSKSGCADAWEYSLLETKFDEFMRNLPITNKNDTCYGTSTLDFNWDDSRTGHIVNNKVSVEVAPVAKLNLKLVKYGEVALGPGRLLSYLSSKNDLGVLYPMVVLGVALAAIVIAAIYATSALAVYLGDVFSTILQSAAALQAKATALCLSCTTCCSNPFTSAVCCPCASIWCPIATYYGKVTFTFSLLTPIAYDYGFMMLDLFETNPPDQIPCFALEDGSCNGKHEISVKVTRVTNPPSIDYTIYKTNWLDQSKSAIGTVEGGSIFPPLQEFDIIPQF